MSSILLKTQQRYLNSFRKENDPLILEMEAYAKEFKVPILDWQSAEFLEQMIFLHRPKRVLEIGTAIGYSTIRVARLLKKKSSIDTIELSQDAIQAAEENFKKAKLTDKINLIEGDALEIMPHLDKKYDFIFLDADKEDYQKLFYYSLMLLRKNGVLFVDNLLWHGYAAIRKVPAKYKVSAQHIKEFNKLFTSQVGLKTTILPIGDGIGIGIKS